MKVRIKYSKYGPIRFVGHLDVQRYFQKVMRRADVDIAYSEGYSPHQLMSFALPLSVGATSDAEYADLTLRSYGAGTLDDVVSRINSVCNEGIRLTDALELAEGAPKAMRAVSACRWRCAVREEASVTRLTPGQLRERLEQFMAQSDIPAVKKTKKGETKINIRPLIHDASVDDEGVFTLLLQAGSENNLKASLMLGAFYGCAEMEPKDLILHRMETYQRVTDAKGTCLEPLICRDASKRIRLI